MQIIIADYNARTIVSLVTNGVSGQPIITEQVVNVGFEPYSVLCLLNGNIVVYGGGKVVLLNANNETLSECETKDWVNDMIETETGILIVLAGGLSLCSRLLLMSYRCVDRICPGHCHHSQQ